MSETPAEQVGRARDLAADSRDALTQVQTSGNPRSDALLLAEAQASALASLAVSCALIADALTTVPVFSIPEPDATPTTADLGRLVVLPEQQQRATPVRHCLDVPRQAAERTDDQRGQLDFGCHLLAGHPGPHHNAEGWSW